MTLTPNNPASRMQHVIKQYATSARWPILPDVGGIVLLLTGQDRLVSEYALRFSNPLRSMSPNYDNREGGWESIPALRERRDKKLAEMANYFYAVLPHSHPRETMIPWVARELGRLDKAIVRSAKKYHASSDREWTSRANFYNDPTPVDYDEAVAELERKGPIIGMWAEREGVDLGKTDLATALVAVESYEVNYDEGGIPQGDVVMEFDDGYTIQALVTDRQLEVEGEVMGHCVGDYCQQVANAEVVILSLRDPKGKPHVTIEWRPVQPGGFVGDMPGADMVHDPAAFIAAPSLEDFRKDGQFIQIRGKQNEMPAEKYRPYVQAFVNEHFSANPLALLMVAMPGQTISFRDHVVKDMDFTEDWSWSGVPLDQADFSGAHLTNVTFGDLEDVKFDGANLNKCVFDGVVDCSFCEALLHTCHFHGDFVSRSDFREAQLESCRFRTPEQDEQRIKNVSFEDSEWYGSSWLYNSFVRCNLSGVILREPELVGVEFVECKMDGFEFQGDVEVRGVILEDYLDLSKVDPSTVSSLVQGAEAVRRTVIFPPGFTESMGDPFGGDE
jgi:uncharacterized protein YjbI with pentapeptide repeats